jgi:hypothetical protein
MRTEDVISHFQTRTEIAVQLCISVQAVSQWGELVPPHQARRLHVLTGGKLKYDPADYVGSYPAHRYLPPAVEAA